MDYQNIAGRVLFGSTILDNAVRGLFIEAVAIDALQRYQKDRRNHRWCLTGYGWKPWDLQRGAAAYDTRVRVQVKATAQTQLWTPTKTTKPAFTLGWKDREKFPDYFSRDMDPWYFGELDKRDLKGYLCDLYLLAWHGPLGKRPERGEDQSDPNNYFYFVVAASAFGKRTKVAPADMLEKPFSCKPLRFEALPRSLDRAADAFLQANKSDRL